MAQDTMLERLSDFDPYDREERCRKAIRTLWKAIIMRAVVGALLIVAVIRSGAAPVALGLAALVLVIIGAGVLPLIQELKKQRVLVKECLAQQNELEQSE